MPAQLELLRSLIQTSPTGYVLPPLATVTLLEVHAVGEWCFKGVPIWRRCYSVRVSAPY